MGQLQPLSLLRYDQGLLEDLEASSGDLPRLLESLTRPSPRLYVRVNTLRISVGDYLDLLDKAGYSFRLDEDLEEAIWHPVSGPFEVPEYEGRVVADKRAAESVLMGSDLYAPGVVSSSGVSRGGMVSIVSPNGLLVGSGVAVMSGGEMARGGRGLAVRVTHPRYRVPRVRDLPGHSEGLVYGQSISSMYVARIADPPRRGLIIDLTAAPGGKVSHVAQLAGREATIIAVDRPSKVEALRETLGRLGMGWVRVVGGDSRRLSRDHPSLEGRADLVIVDPPCTSIGVVPKVYDKKTLRDAVSMARYQFQFLAEAARLLKRGGRLVYSTCTLTSKENEALVEAASEILGLEPVKPDFRASRGSWNGLGLRILPHRDGATGFFISLMVKTRASP